MCHFYDFRLVLCIPRSSSLTSGNLFVRSPLSFYIPQKVSSVVLFYLRSCNNLLSNVYVLCNLTTDKCIKDAGKKKLWFIKFLVSGVRLQNSTLTLSSHLSALFFMTFCCCCCFVEFWGTHKWWNVCMRV